MSPEDSPVNSNTSRDGTHGPRAPNVEIPDEDWRIGMETYFLNVVRPTRLVTPVMQKQKAGSIINISTAWAFEPTAKFPTSAVFRAGSRGVHENLRRHLLHRQRPDE